MKTIIKNFLFKKRFKIMKNNKGFSLMEVMVAVGIIGVVSGAGIPIYKKYMTDAKRTTSQNTLSQLYKVGNLLLTEVDAPGTNFTATLLNEKITGAIEAKDAKYKAENQWCIDIAPTNGAPAGCVDNEGVISLDKAGITATDIKKESLCKLYNFAWAANACTAGSAPNKKDCKTTGGATVEGKCGA